MKKHLSLSCLLVGFWLLLAMNGPSAHAQSDKCPRVYREGEILRTDPAQSYQWYRNGELIPGATEQTYTPTGTNANYSVQVEGKASTPFELVPVTLSGQAFDEHLRPVANARITVGSQTVQSDEQGKFLLGPVAASTTILLRGEKAGHWTSQRRIKPTGSQTHVQIMLRSQPFEHELSGERGGTISRGPFFLTLQPNGVLDANNRPYTGVVKIALNGGRPDDANFGWMMPGGDFMAQDAMGRERILFSYGFLSAHLQTPSGQPLKLDPNIGAQLRFVMPHTMVKAAPDSLPLWHFDETVGIWKEEGIARRAGAAYVGTVRHFSSWNCDVPAERATVRGRVVDCKGRPVSRSPIRVGQRIATTDSAGLYNCFVPSQVGFTVRSTSQNLTDTLIVRPLQPEVIKNLSDLQSSGSGMTGYSVIDANNVLTIYTYDTHGQVRYSINNGISYQTRNTFPTHIDSTYHVLVKDSMDCPNRLNYVRLGRKTACVVLDSASFEQAKRFGSIEEALASEETVYVLNLWGDNLAKMPNLIHDYFTCLQWLRLGNNQLTSLPESIDNLLLLKYLDICDNQLTSLPESFGNLSQLIALHMYNNQLSSIPNSLLKLNQLSGLDLHKNHLTVLPDSIENLTQVKWLHLDENRLTSIPESFGNLKQLQKLKLNRNQLTSLPESFGNLNQLSQLTLHSNRLMKLPESISKLTNLKYLNLIGNPIPPAEIERIRRALPNCNVVF